MAQAGIPLKREDCPNYGMTFTNRLRPCKCPHCVICGGPKHCAVHGGVMGRENESIVWGHEYKSSYDERKTA
jgi:hypothetical protein